MEHFTGAGWHIVPPPAIPNQSSYEGVVPDGVRAISTNDVWISVEGQHRDGTTTAFFFHWNGIKLSYVPNAPTLTYPFRILAISGVSSNNVFALAQSLPAGFEASPNIQLERWDGTRWSLVSSYSNSRLIFRSGLEVFAANDMWLNVELSNGGVILHWNGTSFTPVALPALNGFAPEQATLGGTASNDIWAISNNPAPPNQAYIAHRSSSWAAYNTSLVAQYRLNDIVDFKPGYALITAIDPHGNLALLVYNGYVRWRPTSSPFPTGFDGLFGAVAIKGTTSFWAGYNSTNALNPQGADVLIKCPSIPPAPS